MPKEYAHTLGITTHVCGFEVAWYCVAWNSSVVSGSHRVPSGFIAHIPVEGSQVSGATWHVELSDTHPTVKQSPTRMSSRAKSPVRLFPEVYLEKG